VLSVHHGRAHILHILHIPVCPPPLRPQAGFGSILLSRSLLVTDSLLLQPRLESATALAAATAQQYFGMLLLPQGPEDDWLLQGLAGACV
jgi:hypothetical protein